MKEVHFVRKDNPDITFCIARESSESFRLWKRCDELNCTVVINGKNYGTGWEARCAIEELFGEYYKLESPTY